jgi:threonine aldolase
MRRAMAEAVVGDEHEREDPTTLALEQRVAALLGQERALFVPTATMANQIALCALTRPGDELVAEASAHVLRAEGGGHAVHGGLSVKAVPGVRGLFGPEAVRDAMSVLEDFHQPQTRIVCLENTHNTGGGTVWPLELLRSVVTEARTLGLAAHLDGARLMNAVVASGVAAAEIGGEFDTVTLCLSKGLGCPLGAVLAGGEETMARAWRLKKLFGGAMRQSGIVAAAGLYALDHHVARLAEDHANARLLAEGLAEAGWPVDPDSVETNFVHIRCGEAGLDRDEAMAALRAEGVLVSPTGPDRLRALTHLDVDADAIRAAIAAAKRAAPAVLSA